ncbi:hypothetical protein D082_19360 [Synechocystis sp. PCC 6714]|nr:hypothetical protein D082_19360 [Synechocystis sp. PCC 6714]
MKLANLNWRCSLLPCKLQPLSASRVVWISVSVKRLGVAMVKFV